MFLLITRGSEPYCQYEGSCFDYRYPIFSFGGKICGTEIFYNWMTKKTHTLNIRAILWSIYENSKRTVKSLCTWGEFENPEQNSENLCCTVRKVSEQQQLRVEVSQNMLDSTNSGHDFMSTIITGDESWVYGYDPETK